MDEGNSLDDYLNSLPLGAEFEFTMHPVGWNLELIEDKAGKRKIALRYPFPLLDDGYIRLVSDDSNQDDG